jgi:hypothetical protein
MVTLLNSNLMPTANLRVKFITFSAIIKMQSLLMFLDVVLEKLNLNFIRRNMEAARNGMENKPSSILMRSSFYPWSWPFWISFARLYTSIAMTRPWTFNSVSAQYASVPFGSKLVTE